MRIYTRAEWGARRGDGVRPAPLPATETWLHHSGTRPPSVTAAPHDDFAAARELERIGQARFSAGISYTFVVTPTGRVLHGHSPDREGTHTYRHNRSGRGIVLVGNYERITPPEPMIAAVAQLLVAGAAAGWWRTAQLTGGHRDVRDTVCPGDRAYALIGEINRRAEQLLGDQASPDRGDASPTAERDGTAAPSSAAELPRLASGQRSAAVRRWQEWLLATVPELCTFASATGYYGRATVATTAAFQAAVGVTGPDADGRRVGPRTLAAAARRGYRG